MIQGNEVLSDPSVQSQRQSNSRGPDTLERPIWFRRPLPFDPRYFSLSTGRVNTPTGPEQSTQLLEHTLRLFLDIPANSERIVDRTSVDTEDVLLSAAAELLSMNLLARIHAESSADESERRMEILSRLNFSAILNGSFLPLGGLDTIRVRDIMFNSTGDPRGTAISSGESLAEQLMMKRRFV